MAQANNIWPVSDSEMAGRVRGHDWSATRLGPAAAWSERLKLMVEQVLANPLVASLVCGPEHILIYNDAAAKLYGDRHPAALGRSLPMTFPEGWAAVAPFYGRAFAGETVQVAGQPVDTRGGGEMTNVFDAQLTPVRETDGRVAYVHMTGSEVGKRLRAEATLRESDTRHRLLVESWAQSVWETDGNGVVVADSPSWRDYTGQTLQELLGYGWLDAIHPDDRGYAEQQWRQAMAVRGLVNAEFRLRAPGGGWRWTNVRAAPVIDAGGRIEKWAGINIDIDARKRAERALRETEERQAFHLQLSDALASLTASADIQAEAARSLAEHLKIGWCYFNEFDDRQSYSTVRLDYHRVGLPSLVGVHDLSGEQKFLDLVRSNAILDMADLTISERFSDEAKAYYGALGLRSALGVPLLRHGRLVAVLLVADTCVRLWTHGDGELLRGAAERTWTAIQRARTEAELRDSEERFAQFAASSSDALWIRDAATLAMEYTSPAIQTVYGISPDGILGDMQRWVELIVPEDRDTAIAHIEQAQAGASVTHEFRIRRPADGEIRWIKNTDFPLRDAEGRVQRIGGIAEDITEAKRSAIRLEVLVNELQHRARNLLGVITAIADRTVKQGGSVEAFEERLQALSRAQGLLSQGGSDTVEVGALVRAELAAFAIEESDRVAITGPEVSLTARQVQNFALALHELTTNAMKYGALKGKAGRLTVTWQVVLDKRDRRRLALSWVESGVSIVPNPVPRRGYGTELIQEALSYALQAMVAYEIGPDGVRCRIEMPVS